jgi:hypothetical protein
MVPPSSSPKRRASKAGKKDYGPDAKVPSARSGFTLEPEPERYMPKVPESRDKTPTKRQTHMTSRQRRRGKRLNIPSKDSTQAG